MRRSALTRGLAAAAIAMTLLAPAVIYASEETPSSPDIAAGFAGTLSLYNVWEEKGGLDYHRFNFGPGYGGGLVFEKMFTNLLGVHSALLVDYFSFEMKIGFLQYTSGLVYRMPAIKFYFRSWHLDIPLALILSFNTEKAFSFNILAGVRFGTLIDAHQNVPNFTATVHTVPAIPAAVQFTAGFTAGISIKFHVSRYVDIFASIMGTLNVNEFFRDTSDKSRLYSAQVATGVLFRTNIFPMTAVKQ